MPQRKEKSNFDQKVKYKNYPKCNQRKLAVSDILSEET